MKRSSSSKGGRVVTYWVTSALALTHVALILNSARTMTLPSHSPIIATAAATDTVITVDDTIMTTKRRNNINATSAYTTAVVAPSHPPRDDDNDDYYYDDDRAHAPTVMPRDPRMYLIHVGKAGGTTLVRAFRLSDTIRSVRCMTNVSSVEIDIGGRGGEGGDVEDVDVVDDTKRDACYGHSSKSSQLERRTLGYYHMWGHGLDDGDRTWLMENTNVFLYTVRDPIDRLISAYNFHKQLYHEGDAANLYPRFYEHCFPNVSFNDAIYAIRYGHLSVECKRLGVEVLMGRLFHGGGRHFRFNYEYYARKTIDVSPRHALAVIRTSELWDDASNLDRMLGGTGNFGDRHGTRHRHGSDAYAMPYDAHIDDENAIYLCCLVYAEMDAYQRLILGAANLDDTQKRETLDRSLHRCRIGTQHANVDPVHRPFSWRKFRHGRTCIDSLKNVHDME